MGIVLWDGGKRGVQFDLTIVLSRFALYEYVQEPVGRWATSKRIELRCISISMIYVMKNITRNDTFCKRSCSGNMFKLKWNEAHRATK